MSQLQVEVDGASVMAKAGDRQEGGHDNVKRGARVDGREQ